MDHVATLEQQAIDFARAGEFGADARRVNEEITRLAPTNQAAWTRLARCCLEAGQLDAAAAALDAALSVNPQNTIARNLHLEIAKRRAGPSDLPAARPRARSGTRTSRAAGTARRAAPARGRASEVAPAAGIGRAEFIALGHLPPAAAAEALTPRLEPLLMALNERPFAARVTEARNRAGQPGVRLFRRGSLQGGGEGRVGVAQQGGRWEPQLYIGLLSAAHWGRDALCAGIGFDTGPGEADERAQAGRERVLASFEGFQALLASTWRVHLSDWLRAGAGFIQIGPHPPATDLLPQEAVARLVSLQDPAGAGWIFCGRWLFADRSEDVGVMTDPARLLRWLEGTFSDLLPLWGDVYRRIR